MLQAFQKQYLVFAVLGVFATVLPAQDAHRELLRGDRAYRQNNYAEAEQYYRQAESKRSGAQSWYNLGNSLYQQEQYEEASSYFRKAAEASADPDMRARAWHNLGNAQFRQGDLPAAIEAYKNALRNNPQDAEARHNLALALKATPSPSGASAGKGGEQSAVGGEQGSPTSSGASADKSSEQSAVDGQQLERSEIPMTKETGTAGSGQQQGRQEESGKGRAAGEAETTPSGEQAGNGKPAPMNKTEAEKLLQIMEREEQRVQQRLRRAASSPPKSAKDW